MATCPRCGGFLHEHHKCRGRWGRRGRDLTASIVGLSAGALVAFLMADGPPVALILTCALLGAVLITAFRRFAKF